MFEDVEKIIMDVAKDFSTVTCISGRRLVPEDENLYGDMRLHPKDKGFAYYYKCIVDEVLKASNKEAKV